MTMRPFWLSLALLGCFASAAYSQALQLPSFSIFNVDTTVSVPDGGGAYIGGVKRSSSGSTAFGPALGPRRAIGTSTSASALRVKATVHDFAAHDEALLGSKSGTKGSSAGKGANATASSALPGHAGRLARAGESSAGQAPSGSLAEARRQHAAELAARDDMAQEHIDKARTAAANGKPKVAKMFYKMAARDVSDELRRSIQREIDALDRDSPTGSGSSKVASASESKQPRAKSSKASERGF
jgi:hypothetical protein